MTFGIVNPGTELVRDARLDRAAEAILHFVEDLRTPVSGNRIIDGVTVSRHAHADGDGWYGFKLERAGLVCYVLMPGVPFEIARGTPERGCMHGPRLYVNGNSWWWPHALNIVHAALLPPGYEQPDASNPFTGAPDAQLSIENANWGE